MGAGRRFTSRAAVSRRGAPLEGAWLRGETAGGMGGATRSLLITKILNYD